MDAKSQRWFTFGFPLDQLPTWAASKNDEPRIWAALTFSGLNGNYHKTVKIGPPVERLEKGYPFFFLSILVGEPSQPKKLVRKGTGP